MTKKCKPHLIVGTGHRSKMFQRDIFWGKSLTFHLYKTERVPVYVVHLCIDDRNRFLLTNKQTTIKSQHPSGFHLPRKPLVQLNRLRSGVGRFAAHMDRWGFQDSQTCPCGAKLQNCQHICIALLPYIYYTNHLALLFM